MSVFSVVYNDMNVDCLRTDNTRHCRAYIIDLYLYLIDSSSTNLYDYGTRFYRISGEW